MGATSLSAVLTRPARPDRAPAVLLLQGLDCASLDPPSGQTAAYVPILNALDEAGYVTMRVDKSGVGQSGGPPCGDTDFAAEVQGFRAAIRTLRGQAFVDPHRIYLFGHSTGGLIATLLASEPGVAGVVVYGADPQPWRQYELANARRQWQLQGLPAERVDQLVDRWAALQKALYDERMPSAEATNRFPEFRSVFDAQGRYQGRSMSYFRQLASTDWEKAWRNVTVPVAVVVGDSDALSAPGDQLRTARIVESARPGATTIVHVDCADHWFRRVCSARDSLTWRWAGPVNPAVAEAIVGWLGRK